MSALGAAAGKSARRMRQEGRWAPVGAASSPFVSSRLVSGSLATFTLTWGLNAARVITTLHVRSQSHNWFCSPTECNSLRARYCTPTLWRRQCRLIMSMNVHSLENHQSRSGVVCVGLARTSLTSLRVQFAWPGGRVGRRGGERVLASQTQEARLQSGLAADAIMKEFASPRISAIVVLLAQLGFQVKWAGN